MGRTLPTLRRAWPQDGPVAAICVQNVDVRCALQFTLLHGAGSVLHRRTSRVIHRLKLYRFCDFNFLHKTDSAGPAGRGVPADPTLVSTRYQVGLHDKKWFKMKKRGGGKHLRAKRVNSLHLRCTRTSNKYLNNLASKQLPTPDPRISLALRSAIKRQGWQVVFPTTQRAETLKRDRYPRISETVARPNTSPGCLRLRNKANTSSQIERAGKTLNTSNDPSAGSPTETLLRLLLPLNAQVWESFRTTL